MVSSLSKHCQTTTSIMLFHYLFILDFSLVMDVPFTFLEIGFDIDNRTVYRQSQVNE
jgi:hypothetical protein